MLLGLLPPLLYTAALQTPLVDFTANRRPIMLLSVGLVVVTTFAVGAVVNWLIPGLGWAGSLAIGAVVAPPDAVAATAIGRRIGLPRRVVTVLEGESLLNDATALVALRTAIAALAGAVSIGEVGLDFVIAAGGGALAGFLVFVVVAWLRRRTTTTVIDTTISLITPYAAYMLAESVEASGVIAVVVAGLLLGHKAPIIQTAPSRIAERTTWGAISFLLENAVFLLIGLQTNWIVQDVLNSDLPLGWIALICGAVLVTVIGVRLLWVFVMRAPLTLTRGKKAGGGAGAFLVGWAGMRGVVTLAAAFIIPTDVPYREVLLLIALSVVAGTLFLQGLTLPWLTRRLDVESPDPASDALTGPSSSSRQDAPGWNGSGRSTWRTRTTSSTWSASGSTSAPSPPGSGSAPPETSAPPPRCTASCAARCWPPNGRRCSKCAARAPCPATSSPRCSTCSTWRNP